MSDNDGGALGLAQRNFVYAHGVYTEALENKNKARNALIEFGESSGYGANCKLQLKRASIDYDGICADLDITREEFDRKYKIQTGEMVYAVRVDREPKRKAA